MTEKKHIITRRDFIRSGSSAVLGSLLGLPPGPPAKQPGKVEWC